MGIGNKNINRKVGAASNMNTQIHNPRKVPQDKLPEGRRFLTKEERKKLNDNMSNMRFSVVIYMWEDYKDMPLWDSSGWKGHCEIYTYCVPNDFDVEKHIQENKY